MIKIENVDVHGFEAAIRGMRNPLASWDKSDSDFSKDIIGKNDIDLMTRLAKAGPEHRKYMRMINVTFDITAPVYWLAEFDTYKVGTCRNSTSFMHKGLSKEFEISDFDIDESTLAEPNGVLTAIMNIISTLNLLREEYLETKDMSCFRTIRQILPMSYKYKSTISLNYEVLMNMYNQRKSHRLSEWIDFCKWIEELPGMEYLLKGSADDE